MTNTTAGSAIKLGTTSGGNEVTKTVTYTASTNTITIDPSSDLTEDTTYYATLSNAWYYQNGACAQGASESISFTTDSVAPTVSSVAYRLTEAGTDGLTNASLTDTFYAVVTFSEEVSEVISDTASARPEIKSKAEKSGSTSVTEFQYDIVSSTTNLADGDCKETGTGNNDGKIYTCRYTGSSLSGSNLFKTYATELHRPRD